MFELEIKMFKKVGGAGGPQVNNFDQVCSGHMGTPPENRLIE